MLTPEQLRAIVEDAVARGVGLHWTFFVFAGLLIVAAAIRPLLEAYMATRGRTLATKQDILEVVQQLRHTTQASEEIKAEISRGVWLKERRWDRKWDCYVEIVKSLGEIHALVRESLDLDPISADYPHEFADRRARANEAFLKVRQFASVARLAVAPNVRTVLTRLGDEWNRAGPDGVQMGIVALWGWLVVTDIGRNDLFGEPREMSDEFVVEEVPTP